MPWKQVLRLILLLALTLEMSACGKLGLFSDYRPTPLEQPTNPGPFPDRPFPDETGLSSQELTRILKLSPLPPPPPSPSNRFADDPAAARFGQFLFFETRLSINNGVACATCHKADQGFSDGLPLGVGLAQLPRNSQSLFNVAYQRWFLWDGRADSLWLQAIKPLENPKEMGSNRLRVLHLVYDDQQLSAAYESIFGPLPDADDSQRFPVDAMPLPDDELHPWHQAWQGMSAADRDAVNRFFSNLGKAIEAYERKLVSRNAVFDRFVKAVRQGVPADQAGLSASALRGLKLFVGRAGCVGCHSGPSFSDGSFHNVGLGRHPTLPPDRGRIDGISQLLDDPFNGQSLYSDILPDDPFNQVLANLSRTDTRTTGAMKTPGLRNITDSGPYMHDGRFNSLIKVLEFYVRPPAIPAIGQRSRFLVPHPLSFQDGKDLVDFLGTLTGEALDPELLVKPSSPVLPDPG